jgi:O-antigen/teichoic acid export membrane protein
MQVNSRKRKYMEAETATNTAENQEQRKTGRRGMVSLVLDGISNLGPQFVSMVINFFLTPYLITTLGRPSYGVWILVSSFVGYYGVFRLGVGGGLMRYVPFHIGRGDYDSACGVFSTGMSFFLLIGLVTGVVSIIVAEPLARFYGGGPEFATLVRLTGFAAAVECPMRVLDAAMRARERWMAANTILVVYTVIRAAGLAMCVYLGYGLVGMGYMVLAVTLFSSSAMAYYFLNARPLLHFKLSLIKISHALDLTRFGSLMAFANILWSQTFQGHSLIIGKLEGAGAVTIYSAATGVMKNVHAMVIRPNQVFFPRFAYLDGNNDPGQARPLLLRATLYNAAFSASLILAAVVAGPPFIRLWLGSGFEQAYPVIMVLAAGYLVETSLAVNSFYLSGIGRQGVLTAFAFAEGGLGIALSIALGLKYGKMGVAFGFLVSVVIFRGLALPFYVCRILKVGLARYFLGCLSRPWLVLAVLAVASYWLGLPEQMNTWIKLVVISGLVAAVYAVCTYYFVLDAKERKKVIGLAGQIGTRLRNRLGFGNDKVTDAQGPK